MTTDPESARGKGYHAAPEPRLLAFRRNPLVYALAQPDIRLHVPRVKEDLEVRREFNVPDFHVGCAFPAGLAFGADAREAQTCQYGSTLWDDSF